MAEPLCERVFDREREGESLDVEHVETVCGACGETGEQLRQRGGGCGVVAHVEDLEVLCEGRCEEGGERREIGCGESAVVEEEVLQQGTDALGELGKEGIDGVSAEVWVVGEEERAEVGTEVGREQVGEDEHAVAGETVGGKVEVLQVREETGGADVRQRDQTGVRETHVGEEEFGDARSLRLHLRIVHPQRAHQQLEAVAEDGQRAEIHLRQSLAAHEAGLLENDDHPLHVLHHESNPR